MKLYLYPLVFLLFVGFACSKNEDPDAKSETQKNLIGSKEYTFNDAAYIDWGYDAEHDQYDMDFILVPDSYRRGEDDLEQYPYVIHIETARKGSKLGFGSFGLEEASVAFSEGNLYYYLTKGSISINRDGENKFTINIDGQLNNGQAMKASINREFYRELAYD